MNGKLILNGNEYDIELTDEQVYELERLPTYEQLVRFKKYWDELYGQGLEVANWHMNGALQSFDSFYETAIEYMKNKK